MPRYISLVNWTDQGIRNFKATPDRANAARDLAGKMGGKLDEIYWTVGPYDLVVVTEFPDDETGTAFLLALGALGNVRTTTLRAFNTEEIARVISKAG
jgi:uncharacterized protein with GYD domain